MNRPLKTAATLYAFAGALIATVGIGWAYPDPEAYSLMLAAAGVLLLSASLILWTRE